MEDDEEIEASCSSQASTLERILAFKLTDFLSSDVRYSLRRLLPADLKELYRGPDEGTSHKDRKGGRAITPFLTWDW